MLININFKDLKQAAVDYSMIEEALDDLKVEQLQHLTEALQ